MTVATVASSQTYTATGTVADFSFGFRCDDPDWVYVLFGSLGVHSGFTVQLHADQVVSPGGHVLFAVAPPVGTKVTIKRIIPLVQTTDYRPYDGFPAEVHEAALDRLTLALQDEAEARKELEVGVVGQVPMPDVGASPVTPTGSLVTKSVADWLARVEVEGGPIPVTAGGGVKRTLQAWVEMIVEGAGGGITTPTGNRIGAGTLAERDAITDWVAGDLWFDTEDDWHPYRYNGMEWVDILNPLIASRNRTFVQGTPPENPSNGVPLVDGDLWFDSDGNYVVSRWDGTRWAVVADTSSIDTARLFGSIDPALLADGTIDAAKLAAAMKGDGTNPISWLAANAIGANHIIANAIKAGHIQAGAVQADHIAAGAITAGKIAAGSITAAELRAGEVLLPGGVIQAINDGQNAGLRIAGERIQLDGTVTFASGYNPATKADAAATTAALAAKADASTVNAALAGKADAAATAQALADAQATAQAAVDGLDGRIPWGSAEADITTISGGKITTGTLSAQALVSLAQITTKLKTANYNDDGDDWGSGTPSQGLIIDGTATGATPPLRVAPSGIQIGSSRIDQTWLTQGRLGAIMITGTANQTTVSATYAMGLPTTGHSRSGDSVRIATGAGAYVNCIVSGSGRRSDGAILLVTPAIYGADASGVIGVNFMGWDGASPSPLVAYGWSVSLTIAIFKGTF